MYYGKLLRQIVEALRGLTDRSEDIREIGKKIEQLSAAITHQQIEQQKANQEEWEKTQEVLSRPRRTNPNEQASSEANQQRRHWQNFGLQGVLTLGTWLAFVAAAIYAWEAHRQLVIAERPWIVIGGMNIARKYTLLDEKKATIGINYLLQNKGHSPANVFVFGEVVRKGSLEGGLAAYSRKLCDAARVPFEEKQWSRPWLVAPEVPMRYDVMYEDGESNDDVERMAPIKVTWGKDTPPLINVGCILYRQADGVGPIRHTPFIAQIDPSTENVSDVLMLGKAD